MEKRSCTEWIQCHVQSETVTHFIINRSNWLGYSGLFLSIRFCFALQLEGLLVDIRIVAELVNIITHRTADAGVSMTR